MKIKFAKKLFLRFAIGAGFSLATFALFAWNIPVSYGAAFENGGKEPPTPPPYSCTANTSIISGQSATFVADGGESGDTYEWSYPAGLAACPNTDPNCTTVPLTNSLAAGVFSVSIKSSAGATVASLRCPAVGTYQAATITTDQNFSIGPYGNKDGSHYCPAGSAAVGFGQSQGGHSYQNVPLICATLIDQVKNYTSGTCLDGNCDIDSGDKGGSRLCTASEIIYGAVWAKNGQIDYGRCAAPPSDLSGSRRLSDVLLANTIETPRIDYTGKVICPSGYVAHGFQNFDGKNDAWGYLYCSQTFVITPSLNFGANLPTSTTIIAGGGAPVLSTSFSITKKQVSITAPSKIGANISVPFYIRNVGLSGSKLNWQCSVAQGYTPPPGVTVNLKQCNSRTLNGGAPSF